jgi:hypothetical protein
MNVSRLIPNHVAHREQRGGNARALPEEGRFSAALGRAIGSGTRLPVEPQGSGALAGQAQGAPESAPSIAPLGTPNNLIQRGQLLELGGGVYYNTSAGTYQDLSGSIVGTNRHAVQQYTDPVAYLFSGVAYEASDAHLRATVPDLDAVAPPGAGSPTAILNNRWAHDQIWGGPPLTLEGTPVYPRQAEPVPLMAYQGVLKAPGPPPLAGSIPPWDYLVGAKEPASNAAEAPPNAAQGTLA